MCPLARTQLMLEGPVLPTLLRLSLPNFINLLSIAALITFDGVFVGRLGTAALAGASLVFPFVVAAQHLAASGVGGAVSSAIARALGAGDRDRADALATHAFALAIGLAALTSLVMLTLGPVFYRWMGGRGEVLEAACTYSAVVFCGTVSIYLLSILASAIRGTGDMTRPALALAAGVGGHVLLSPLLIFGWGPLPALGIAGAPLGLVVSFGAAAVWVYLHLRGPDCAVRLRFAGVRWRWALFREFLVVGVPGTLNVGVNNMSIAILTGMTGMLGAEAQLGYAIGARLEYIVIPLAFVFGTALVAMVGTNWGAGRHARARRVAWTGGVVAGVACGAVGMLCALLPETWMRLFTDEPEVVRAGSLYLRVVAPAYAFFGFGQALYFASQGFGDPLPAVLANVARLALSAGGGAIVVSWLDGGAAAVFAGIAAGFVLYAALNAWILTAGPVAPHPPRHPSSSAPPLRSPAR